jgi:cold shock CspA family protein
MTVGFLKSFGGGGYGFFAVDGERDIFVHGNQFAHAELEPVVDAEYEFEIDKGVDGRVRARNIRKVSTDE